MEVEKEEEEEEEEKKGGGGGGGGSKPRHKLRTTTHNGELCSDIVNVHMYTYTQTLGEPKASSRLRTLNGAGQFLTSSRVKGIVVLPPARLHPLSVDKMAKTASMVVQPCVHYGRGLGGRPVLQTSEQRLHRASLTY